MGSGAGAPPSVDATSPASTGSSAASLPSANENEAVSPATIPSPRRTSAVARNSGSSQRKPDSLSCGTSGRTSSTTSSIGVSPIAVTRRPVMFSGPIEPTT